MRSQYFSRDYDYQKRTERKRKLYPLDKSVMADFLFCEYCWHDNHCYLMRGAFAPISACLFYIPNWKKIDIEIHKLKQTAEAVLSRIKTAENIK